MKKKKKTRQPLQVVAQVHRVTRTGWRWSPCFPSRPREMERVRGGGPGGDRRSTKSKGDYSIYQGPLGVFLRCIPLRFQHLSDQNHRPIITQSYHAHADQMPDSLKFPFLPGFSSPVLPAFLLAWLPGQGREHARSQPLLFTVVLLIVCVCSFYSRGLVGCGAVLPTALPSNCARTLTYCS